MGVDFMSLMKDWVLIAHPLKIHCELLVYSVWVDLWLLLWHALH